MPNVYHDLVRFTKIGDITWRMSDCEELVGAILGVMGLNYCIVPDELYLIKKMSFSPKFVFPSNPPKVVPVT